MGVFEKLFFILIGISMGNLIGRYNGKTEEQKVFYGVIGGVIAGVTLLSLSFIY